MSKISVIHFLLLNCLVGTSGVGAGIDSGITDGATIVSTCDTTTSELGFIPGPLGMVADLANAGVSLARGDLVGAGINVIAIVPGFGDAVKGGKMATKGAGAAAGAVGVGAKGAADAAGAGKIAANATQGTGKNVTGAVNNIAKEKTQTADIGRKLDYLYGNATGNVHNIQRSLDMQRQLERIGLHNTPSNRAYLVQHLQTVLNNPTNVPKTLSNGNVIRESLLMGPNGGVKLITIWNKTKLVTAIIKGGQ